MKTLKKVGLVLLSLIVLALLVGLVMPKDAAIKKSTLINASAEQIFDHVKYFEKRAAWYPWGLNDTSMKAEIKGDDGTVGATRSWEGDSVGTGIQTLTRIVANKRVDTDLKFILPEASEVATSMELEEVDGGTEVTWVFKIPFGYPMNLFIPFVKGDIHDAVGPDFEKGLAMLKDICDKEAKGIFRGFQVAEIDFPGKKFLGKRAKIKLEELTSFYTETFPPAAALLEGGQAEMDGMPCGLIYEFDEVNGLIDLAAAIGFKGEVSLAGYEILEVPAGKALLINFYGPYEASDKAHYAMEDYMKYHNLTSKIPVIEEYVTDPGLEPDPNKWLTKITYLLAN